MPTIGREYLEPGTVVSADVLTSDGRLLAKTGTVLEDKHIALFERFGVASVEVEPQVDDAALDEASEYVRGFFSFVDPDQPVAIATYAHVAKLTAKRMATGWKLPSMDQRRAANVEHLSDAFPMEVVDPSKIALEEIKLGSFPDVYFRLRKELGSPTFSVKSLADIITRDVSLTAKLLKLANSPLYALPGPVESIERAISVIGTAQLSMLALGVSAVSHFKGIPPELMDMKAFWRHSVGCAIFASILAKAMGDRNTERYFLSGLLHDVGRLVLFKTMPYVSAETLLHARENSLPVVVAEETLFGFTHPAVSDVVFAKWDFPPQISVLVKHHHDPLSAPNPRDAAIVHMADFLANAASIAAGSLYALPPLAAKAWELTGLADSDVGAIMDDYESQAEVTFSAFF